MICLSSPLSRFDSLTMAQLSVLKNKLNQMVDMENSDAPDREASTVNGRERAILQQRSHITVNIWSCLAI